MMFSTRLPEHPGYWFVRCIVGYSFAAYGKFPGAPLTASSMPPWMLRCALSDSTFFRPCSMRTLVVAAIVLKTQATKRANRA